MCYAELVKIYIDQSGKIEYTSKNTVVAFSNGQTKSILVKATEKRQIQSYFRLAGKPDIFIYKTFAVLIFFLIRDHLNKISELVIDIEYPGKDSLIKNFLVELLKKDGVNLAKIVISFSLIGRQKDCHIQALTVHRGRANPDKIADTRSVLKWLL